jgi:hypothetical protein
MMTDQIGRFIARGSTRPFVTATLADVQIDLEWMIGYYRQKVVMCWNGAKALISKGSSHPIKA